jgi:hypothetical protein
MRDLEERRGHVAMGFSWLQADIATIIIRLLDDNMTISTSELAF